MTALAPRARSRARRAACLPILFVTACGAPDAGVGGDARSDGPRFEISFAEEAHAEPITGRVYVMISDTDERTPSLQIGTAGVPFYGKDVTALAPGENAVIDGSAFGYPVESLGDLPAGDYFVQAFVNVYSEFPRADGHTVWMHDDQWEGQRWNRSPGNLYSDVERLSIDPSRDESFELTATHVIPPVTVPADTKWVKRIKFQSDLLTAFWGRPIFLGATVLLPRSYDDTPERRYPVNYIQGHFSTRAPNGFTEEPGHEFSEYWMSDAAPEMIAVTFQHPTPYYDDSYVVNSPNVGPYDDAIMQELIPAVEERFRIIREPRARVLSGGSTGGWISLSMQIAHPDFFGGVFSSCPDPVDFHAFQPVDIYNDANAYYKQRGWLKVPTASDRSTDGVVTLTFEQRNHYELAAGTHGRSGGQIDIFEAAFGPLGDDGYYQPLFDKYTGAIDPDVARYWQQHSDLNYILQENWADLGPRLEGKIHIFTGDMDSHYLNNAVVLMEDFLESTTNPYYDGVIEYGDRQPHCWGPRGAELLEMMAGHVADASGA